MGYGGGDPGQDSKESSSRRGQFSSDKDFRQGKDERGVSDEKSGKKYFEDKSIVCFGCEVKCHSSQNDLTMWPVLESLASPNVKLFRGK